MTTQQVKQALEAWMTEQWRRPYWGELGELENEDIPGLGVVTVVDRQDDRDSNVRWYILKIGDKFYQQSGYNVSHEGTTWDGGFREVRAAEKTVTVWNEI